jgi:hypothetical protein
MLWQLNRFSYFPYRLFGDHTSALGAVIQNIVDVIRLGGEFGALGTERLEMRVQVFSE